MHTRKVCLLCQGSLENRSWKILDIASFGSLENFDFLAAKTRALYNIKSSITVSFSSSKILSENEWSESEVSRSTKSTQITLQLDVMSVLELAQTADRINMRERKVNKEPNLSREFYPGNTKCFT